MNGIGAFAKTLTACGAIAIVCYIGPAKAAAAAATSPFAFACSATSGHGTAATSYRQLLDWTDRYASIAAPDPTTTTRTVDSVVLGFSRSPQYLSRKGDKSKAFAAVLYDARHRVLALCFDDDAWSSFSLVANVPPPPFAVAEADLAGAVTQRGIHLGSPVGQVEAVYGRSHLVHVRGRPPQLSYLREIPMPAPSGLRYSPESAEAWFTIVDGHVASISLATGF